MDKLKRRGILFVLSSPSGAGKTSIARYILDKDKNIKLSVSLTTRKKRKNEKAGIDYDFIPKHFVKDGDTFELDDKQISIIYTPGHMGNHICFQYDKILFSGDHVMGWATSMVSPPYGDLTQFMASCRLLQTKEFDLFLPGHGDPIKNPSERLEFLIKHRLERERQIKETIKNIPLTSLEITEIVYTDIDNSLIPAATRNVFAHLIDLSERGLVDFLGEISEKSKVSLHIK